MEVNDDVYAFMQAQLGYSDEELQLFKDNPRNEQILSKAPELMNKTIVAEVVASHGCNSQHKVGDKLYFDGAGNLLTKKAPKRVCIYALKNFATLIYGVNELIYAGADPSKVMFHRVGCHDVGVRCGGWGNIVMEIKVEDREGTSGQ
jgi:uncharacterized repeat protein (TIGR04076 family)